MAKHIHSDPDNRPSMNQLNYRKRGYRHDLQKVEWIVSNDLQKVEWIVANDLQKVEWTVIDLDSHFQLTSVNQLALSVMPATLAVLVMVRTPVTFASAPLIPVAQMNHKRNSAGKMHKMLSTPE